METNQVGNNIRFYLKEREKSQVDLAQGLGVSKQIINKIVKGKKALKINELVKISDYLEVRLEDLIHETHTCPPSGLEAVHLYGKIESREKADFILSLIDQLSNMDEELAAHGIQV